MEILKVAAGTRAHRAPDTLAHFHTHTHTLGAHYRARATLLYVLFMPRREISIARHIYTGVPNPDRMSVCPSL